MSSPGISLQAPVPVIFATDNGYIPFLAVALVSLIQSTTEDRHYHIYVICKGMSQKDISMLSSLTREKKHISLEFVDIRPYLEQYADCFYIDGISHISAGAYYRFFIPKIFAGTYDKAIYLDCDLVVLDDIAKLYDLDLGSNLLAATRDYGGLFWHKMGQSISTTLKLRHPLDYFNSGVLGINIRQFEKEGTFDALFSCLKEIKTPLCHDQDILNIVCDGRVLFLPEAWNCKCHVGRHLDILQEKMNQDEYQSFLEERSIPKIVHFTSDKKPWNQRDLEEHFHLFWQFARQSPYYETILSRFIQSCQKANTTKNDISRMKLWKYRILSRLTFGATREHYKRKKKNLKDQLRQI